MKTRREEEGASGAMIEVQVSEEKDERARMGGQWILEREPHFALPEPE